MSDSLQPHGLQPARLLCPWDIPGKNIGVGCHFLFQEILPIQGSNPCHQLLLFSHSVMSDSLRSHGLQYARPPCAITNSWSLLKLMSIESVMPSNHLILCHPLLLPPSIFPSIRVFSNESVLRIMWSKYWSFSFSISPFNERPGLVSFRVDWLDLLAVQGILKSPI